MKRYYLRVLTDIDMGSEAFVRSLVSAWCCFPDERLRPEYYDLGEPVRKCIADRGLEAAVQAWTTKMPLMFRRKSKPYFIADFDWRKEKGLDPRPFPWGCFLWLNYSAGDERAVALLKFFIAHLKPAFGSMTLYSEHVSRHFVKYDTSFGTTEKFIGDNLIDKIPGVYWMTYFGPWAIDQIGKRWFENIPASTREEMENGLLIGSYPNSKMIGEPGGRAIEEKIKEHLGKDHFFDISSVNIADPRSKDRQK